MRRPREYEDDGREEEEEEEEVPLHRKRPFGAGLKRTRVEFVRAVDDDETAVTASAASANASAVGDLYASIVLGSGTSTPTVTSKGAVERVPPSDDNPQGRGEREGKEREGAQVCPVCSLPITTSVERHNASLAHQVSLEHSHPPSALDRSRMGLRALEAQGWDPDARQGLGRGGEGMRFPIKVAAKEDNLGIGAVAPGTSGRGQAEGEKAKEREKPLSNRELRAARAREQGRTERLQREIFGRVDVDKYLKRGEEWE